MKRKKVTKKVEPNKKNTEEKSSTPPAEKVFDVSRPGKSMPSSNSRPVIVTHKPNVSDPMVSPQNQGSDAKNTETPSAAEGTEMVMAAPKKSRIEPLHADVVAEDEMPEEVPQEDTANSSSSDEPAEDKEASSREKDTSKETSGDVTDEISDMAAEATSKKEALSEAAKKEAEAIKTQQEVESLVNNKQYFVPINSVQKRRSMKLVVILLVLLVVVLGVLAALDAGLLDIGVTAPTDFIPE